MLTIFKRVEESEFKFVENMKVRIKREQTGEIIEVPFEEYVVGVLAGEMPTTFNIEALKSQAVAARSYVMTRMVYNKDNDYDVVDTVMNQVYLDDNHLRTVWKEAYDEKSKKIREAVNSTYGEYIAYDGKVADAFFFSTSVGKTENSEDVWSAKIPYLRSVDSSFEEGVSPVFTEKKTMSLTDFYAKLDLNYSDKLDVKVINTTSTGRIKEIKINGKNFTGNDVVGKLQIRSNYFTFELKDKIVNITTKGYGHGVGMSQYGAEAMARQGFKYDEILKHYYSGIEIKKI